MTECGGIGKASVVIISQLEGRMPVVGAKGQGVASRLETPRYWQKRVRTLMLIWSLQEKSCTYSLIWIDVRVVDGIVRCGGRPVTEPKREG